MDEEKNEEKTADFEFITPEEHAAQKYGTKRLDRIADLMMCYEISEEKGEKDKARTVWKMLQQAVRERGLEKSPYFLKAQEEVKAFFADVWEDEEARKKHKAKAAKLQTRIDLESSVFTDEAAARAYVDYKNLRNIAEVMKFKTVCHYNNIGIQLLTIRTLAAKTGAESDIFGNGCEPEKLLQHALQLLKVEIDGLLECLGNALIVEAYTGSPYAFYVIASADKEYKDKVNAFYVIYGDLSKLLLSDTVSGFLDEKEIDAISHYMFLILGYLSPNVRKLVKSKYKKHLTEVPINAATISRAYYEMKPQIDKAASTSFLTETTQALLAAWPPEEDTEGGANGR